MTYQPTIKHASSPLRWLQSPTSSPSLLPHQDPNRRFCHPNHDSRTSLHETYRNYGFPRNQIQARVHIPRCRPGRWRGSLRHRCIRGYLLAGREGLSGFLEISVEGGIGGWWLATGRGCDTIWDRCGVEFFELSLSLLRWVMYIMSAYV